jgi:hypothetical protein
MNPLLAGAALALLPECPYFYEFFPDPVDVPDNEGEYLMVKWENPVPWDSIYLQMDSYKTFAFYVSPDSFFTELLLHINAPEACPEKKRFAMFASHEQCSPKQPRERVEFKCWKLQRHCVFACAKGRESY